MARHESFLVRVWWRARPGEDQWGGKIEHLQQRKTCNFHDPEALLAYLREMIGPIESPGQNEGVSAPSSRSHKGAPTQPTVEDALGKSEAFRMGDEKEEPRVHLKPSRR